jgi:hypothetical protein
VAGLATTAGACGSGAGTTTTGTTEGCAMNGVVPPCSAPWPRVAVPALIAASVGSDANATSNATVTVQRWAEPPGERSRTRTPSSSFTRR